MLDALAPLDLRLLDGFQRGFPVVDRPFELIGAAMGVTEAEVIDRLTALRAERRLSRVGATLAPNTLAASTLAALKVPAAENDAIGAMLAQEPGVNHAYLREHHFNHWFVVTGPDRADVDATLARVQDKAQAPLIDLPLVRAFNVDLGFGLMGKGTTPAPRRPRVSVLQDGDRQIAQALTEGLDLVAQPYHALARRIGRDPREVMNRIDALSAAGIVSRLGVIVRHRALGWKANAMVGWDLTPDEITTHGPRLAATPGITLCYERRPVPGQWPYRLFTMIHGRSRTEARATLAAAAAANGLQDVPREVLFSTRCYKQSGAMVARKGMQ